RLRQLGLYDDAVIIFVADHGEELHDHGSWSHGSTLFQEQLRVPLIVRLPGGAHSGTRVQALAQHIDLAPTLAEVLGLTPEESFQGKSLLSLIGNEDLPARRGYAHLDLDGTQATSLVEGHYKLICGNPFGGACRVYDLATDPDEQTDLSDRRPVLAAYLRAQLRAFRIAAPSVEAPTAEIDPELRERLEALGYL
ncbi:MAG: sulfatase/phosphatase domain-containing protein, partial [Acidobacteriota bacterium]